MLQDLIDDESVTFEQVEDALKIVEGNIEDKFENISWLIKEYTAKSEMFKKEEERLRTRRQTFDNKVVTLKKYLLEALEELNMKKVDAGTFTVRKQKNPPSVKVYDESSIPSKYLIQQPSKVDTSGIKEDLKKGIVVDGAGYAPESYHIRIG